jgi:hypothetical protein
LDVALFLPFVGTEFEDKRADSAGIPYRASALERCTPEGGDFGAGYGQSLLVATVVLVGIALYGFHPALSGKPLAWLAAEPS